MMKALAPWDYAIIVLYFLAMLAVGFLSTRLARSKEDYVVAGRRLNFTLFFSCMAALAIGGGVTIGGAKLAYRFGISSIWLGGSIGLGLIVLAFLASSKISQLKALSINEVIEDNYGPAARIFSSALTFIYTIALSVIQVIAIGSLLHGVLGGSERSAMLLGGSTVIFYTFLGGMWSVTLTDIIQFVIKTLGIVILAPFFALHAVGGIGQLTSRLPASHFHWAGIGWDAVLMYVLMYVPGLLIGQDIWQRLFTAKNIRVARTGTAAAGVYSILYALACFVLGACVVLVFPALPNPQDAFVVGVNHFLPTGMRGFVLAAAMAATMSVASGAILASSTILYNDLYVRFIDPHATEDKALWLNRGLALFVGVIVMAVAFLIKDILIALDLSYAYLSGCVFVPVLASFLFKRFSPTAGLASLVVSTAVVTLVFILKGLASSYPILFGMLSGALTYLLVNAIDKKKCPSTLHSVDAEHP